MSSTGLKLRDTRELLARPDQNQPEESVHLHFTGSLQSQEVSIGAKELSTEKTVNSMSPSLAMANANSPPSNQNESLGKETIASQNSSREIEPIPKKKRILEASEILQELKESEKQPTSSEDILARACSAVGIGGDLSDSVVEESLPNHQEHNGEIHRVAPNYPYSRGLRIPPQNIPLSPRLRSVDEIRFRHPFHPAFRPPSESTYGMEIRPLYNHGYPVPSRLPLHPNEAHRYYAVPRYPNRYAYGGPPGHIPPSIPRPPVLRPAPPNAPHEHRPSMPHPTQGYPYDPHHIPRPTIHHVPPTVSQLHHEHRVEPSKIRHIHPATSETRPVQQSHPEIAYRLPNQHSLAVGPVSPEHLSPTSIKHPYPQPSNPIPIQPKLHGNPQNHLQDSRGLHARVNEAYVSGVIHGIHPTIGSPHHNSSQELSCENPFQIPDLQDNKNIAHVSKHQTIASSHDPSYVKVLTSSLEKNKPELSIVSPMGNKTEQAETEFMIDRSTTISRSTGQNSLLPRRPRQPPEPCVELIPILAPTQEEKCSKGKFNERIQQSPPVSSHLDVDRKQLCPPNTLHERQLAPESQIICSPKTYTEMADIQQGESQPKTAKLSEMCGIPLESTHNADSKINENEREESTNKDPKKSFRKRWLNKQEYPSSKRPATQDIKHTEQVKSLETQASLDAVVEKEETTVIVLDDDDEGVTSDRSKQYNPSGVISKGKVGPGQLHCLHSSVYINNMRSASEPPIGTSITQKNITPLGKRPASVPCFAQQLHNARAQYESQNKDIIENVEETAKGNGNDDEFVNRLKLVLNDLISVPVPEVSKLQHLTCPIDELLASLVKRRGALPSKASDPKERLRKDFLVLVKLCMPKELLEDWGWNSSSPEEILDELIKVTNSGVDGSKGNARLNLAREVNSKTPTSPQTLDNSDTVHINHASPPSPYPNAAVASADTNSTPDPVIPVSSQDLESSNQAPRPQTSPERALPPRHAGPILIQYPALSPQHRRVAHPPQQTSTSLHPVPAVSHSSHHPPQISSQQSTALSPPMYHSSTPNTQQPTKWPLTRRSVPPISRPTILLSNNSEPPFPQPEDHLEDEVFTPTNRNPLTVPYSRPQMPVHPQKPVHESIPQNIKPTQEHDRYPPALTVQMPPQNSTHPHNIPITVLHYSQVPQPSPNGPYGQHSSHPYSNPVSTHNIHNPPLHYPRGPYPQPYPYPYYHPNHPPYPRPAYRHASIIHRPHNLPPRLPYSPRSPHRSPTIRLVAQPPAPLSPSHWSGTEEERIVSSAAIKPPA
ncbi:uncharacterized protein [Palaemon carinicauda]|uniref:uncharacterized protein isoform X2 n=1 Tax=Palaemon carinicauda TaxID=392227 RepID=UPI0035B63CB0